MALGSRLWLREALSPWRSAALLMRTVLALAALLVSVSVMGASVAALCLDVCPGEYLGLCPGRGATVVQVMPPGAESGPPCDSILLIGGILPGYI